MQEVYDVIIVGGGITGTSLLYTLSKYTDIKKLLLIEKYDRLATINSNSRNNAQTLHFGDIETNYALEESERIKKDAQRVVEYSKSLDNRTRMHTIVKCQKMVLGVGEYEIGLLGKVYSPGLRKLFPGLRRIKGKEIGRYEPNVLKGREKDEELVALLSNTGYMVDFGKLTNLFANDAKKHKEKEIKILFNTMVKKLDKNNGVYKVETDKKSYYARFVVFATGSYSLYFAKSIGIDKNLSILSVGGNFYTSPRVLNGKVYRVQVGGVPFAAVHGDPDITDKRITRFGPTVSIPPLLEKRHLNTFIDYMKTFDFDIGTAISLEKILFNKDIERIVTKNIEYEVPGIGKYEFLKKEVSKIVPALKYKDLKLVKGIGGIRPQVIDENKRFLVFGAGKIKQDGVIFIITPSPGATSCLGSALKDTIYITEYLGKKFYKERYEKELGRV